MDAFMDATLAGLKPLYRPSGLGYSSLILRTQQLGMAAWASSGVTPNLQLMY